MKKIILFSLLFIGISSLLVSCATTKQETNKSDLEKYNHTIATIGIYPDASIVGGSGYALLEQLELYYSKIRSDSAVLGYDQNGFYIQVDSLTGNIISRVSSDILFDFDKYELRPSEYSIIDAVLLQLQSNGLEKGISIIGHTDSIGTERYNFLLSQKRANSVKDYITSRYQGAVKINTTLGLGESKPIVANDTPENRQLNRRVEIIIEK